MPIVDSLIIWIHLLSASIWVGGSIFIGIVIGPMLKSLANSVEERTVMMIKIGRRFNRIALPALGVLVATGIYNTHVLLASPETVLSSTYGTILVIKVALVASMIAVFGVHVKISGSEIERELANADNLGSVRMSRLRTRIIWLGRVIVGQSVAILFLAAIMDSGI